jgi:hypothetical protein
MQVEHQDEYRDPEDHDYIKQVCDQIQHANNDQEIRGIIEEVFPGWMLNSAEKYSIDYPHLQKNWETVCERANTTKKLIVIVDKIFFDKNHLLLHIFGERMSRTGYVVRRKEELQLCSVCSAAIPTRGMYNFMKEKGLPVPTVWRNSCDLCV